MSRDRDYSVVSLLAKVREYEHALEHIAEENEYHQPSACTSCQRLAQSALDGANRTDFLELAVEELDTIANRRYTSTKPLDP